MTDQPEIFFSYAWGDKKEKGKSREKIVLDLYHSLEKDGYKVAIDKEDVGYTGYISEFMEDIGKGKAIVVVMSEKYARSPYCMFELYEIARNCRFIKEDFRQKVLPIVVEFVDFTQPAVLKEYLTYWENQMQEWEGLMQTHTRQMGKAQFLRYDKIKMVHQKFGELVDWLVDMNSLTPKLLAKNDFISIKLELDKRLANGRQPERPATATAPTQLSTPPPKHLTARPFLSQVFLGREEALVALRKKLLEENNLLLLVNGKGGVGKTSLAAHYYNRYEAEYQHLAWVLSEKSIANALLLLAPSLGLQFAETMSTEERLEHLLTKMAGLPKPCLLVVDNANELEDLQAHLVALGRCHNFHILLTSRLTTVAEAESWPVDGLPEAAALQLFKKYYPQHDAAEDALFAAIHQAVDRNTLVVELLAKNLARLNGIQTHYTLGNLLADLQGRGLLALSQSKPIETGYGAKGPALRKADPQDIITAMYDLGELPEAEKKLLSNLAVLPAENIPFSTLQTLLPGFAPLEDTLNSLATKGWIEQWGAAFKISPVIQEITRAKNPALLEDCRDLIASLKHKLEYETSTGHPLSSSYAEALHYTRYADILCKHIEAADNDLYLLLERLGSYHATTGNLPLALQCYQAANQRIQGLCQAHPDDTVYKNNLAVAYERLGNAYKDIGELTKALGFYEDETKLFKELFEAYPDNLGFKNGLAVAYSKLGDTYSAMGDLPKALGFHEGYLNLRQALFEAYPDNLGFKNGLAIAYEKLGNTYKDMGELAKSLCFYELCAKLSKELFEAYTDNMGFKNELAVAYSKLGETYTAMGELVKALGFYELDANLSKELFEAYPDNVGFKTGLAVSYSKLGETYTAMGELSMALGFYGDMAALYKELFEASPDSIGSKYGLAVAYCKLGETYSAMGELDKALGFYEDMAGLCKALFEAYPDNVGFKNGLAVAYERLGETYTEMGELSKALGFYEMDANLSKELFEAYPDNVGFKNGLAVSYSKLGGTYIAMGEFAKALGFYEQYLPLRQALFEAYPDNVGFKNGLALSYQWLGWFYEKKMMDSEKAMEYYRLSKPLLVELVDKFPDYVEFTNNLNWVNRKLPS